MSNSISQEIHDYLKFEIDCSKRAIYELDNRDYTKDSIENDSLVFHAIKWYEEKCRTTADVIEEMYRDMAEFGPYGSMNK